MNIKIRSIITCLLISLIFFSCGDKKQNIDKNKWYIKCEDTRIASWKYGFALDRGGKPLYYDREENSRSDFVISYFCKSDKEVEKIEGDIIYADLIQFHDDFMYVMDKKKEKRGISVGEDLKIYHKTENCRNWVSKDGKNWEVLEIKYLKETQEKNWAGEPLILVYFKCSYFEGEYYITSLY